MCCYVQHGGGNKGQRTRLVGFLIVRRIQAMRAEKKSMVDEISKKLSESEFMFLADYRGLTVTKMMELRGKLRVLKSSFSVIRNSFLCRASNEAGLCDISGSLLDGPRAMVTGEGDPTGVAKVLAEFFRDNSLPVLKGGSMSGRTLTAADVMELAFIPPRDVLLAKLAYVMSAPDRKSVV